MKVTLSNFSRCSDVVDIKKTSLFKRMRSIYWLGFVKLQYLLTFLRALRSYEFLEGSYLQHRQRRRCYNFLRGCRIPSTLQIALPLKRRLHRYWRRPQFYEFNYGRRARAVSCHYQSCR